MTQTKQSMAEDYPTLRRLRAIVNSILGLKFEISYIWMGYEVWKVFQEEAKRHPSYTADLADYSGNFNIFKGIGVGYSASELVVEDFDVGLVISFKKEK